MRRLRGATKSAKMESTLLLTAGLVLIAAALLVAADGHVVGMEAGCFLLAVASGILVTGLCCGLTAMWRGWHTDPEDPRKYLVGLPMFLGAWLRVARRAHVACGAWRVAYRVLWCVCVCVVCCVWVGYGRCSCRAHAHASLSYSTHACLPAWHCHLSICLSIFHLSHPPLDRPPARAGPTLLVFGLLRCLLGLGSGEVAWIAAGAGLTMVGFVVHRFFQWHGYCNFVC